MSAINSTTNITMPFCLPDPIVMYREDGPTLSVVCIENGCKMSADKVAGKLYDTIKMVQLFFLKAFGICGVDGKGKMVAFTVGWDINNAAWMCEENKCHWKFNDHYAIIPEVVVHEMTHAVVQYFRAEPMSLVNQSGALNESIANVVAIAYRHWSGKSGWNVGKMYDLSVHTDISKLKSGSQDSGYIHDNSNIPSHAFFVAARGADTQTYGIIGRLWLKAMCVIPSAATFSDFAIQTIHLSQPNSLMRNSIASAWVHVRVLSIRVPKPLTAAAPAPKKSWLEKFWG